MRCGLGFCEERFALTIGGGRLCSAIAAGRSHLVTERSWPKSRYQDIAMSPSLRSTQLDQLRRHQLFVLLLPEHALNGGIEGAIN